MIRWLDQDKAEVDPQVSDYCLNQLTLIAESKDLIIAMRNHRNQNLEYDGLVTTIDKHVESIHKENFVTDTVESIDNPEEYYYAHKINYLTPDGRILYVDTYSGGDHGGSGSVEYYDEKGNIIFVLEKSGNVFGYENYRKVYYKEGAEFRSIYHATEDGFYRQCPAFEYTFIPEVENH